MVAVERGPLAAQLRRGVLEYCVLALLRERDHYGFDLVRRLGEGGGMVTSEGTVYPLLSRLRRDGLVETTWQESPSGPPRRWYRITPLGEAGLASFAAEWVAFRTAVDHFLDLGAR
jgi:PadR family transcriptional regulator PadR